MYVFDAAAIVADEASLPHQRTVRYLGARKNYVLHFIRLPAPSTATLGVAIPPRAYLVVWLNGPRRPSLVVTPGLVLRADDILQAFDCSADEVAHFLGLIAYVLENL